MPRRVFCCSIRVGTFQLEAGEAHHLRDVLRVGIGETVELFDSTGGSATATVETAGVDGVAVRVDAVQTVDRSARQLVVATAVPKADRADWLVEKLSELGVHRWIPLKTARSVVHPAGEAKFDRWRRIAIEAAKQSRRAGVMEIGDLTRIEALSFDNAAQIVLSTRGGCMPLATMASTEPRMLLIGPEGGWTDDELSTLVARGAKEASLTQTVLRIETAAIVAAAISLLVASPP